VTNREFDRKTAVVTGACGAVGAEVVAALAWRGAAVTAVDRDGRALCDLVEGLRSSGLPVAGRQVDITSACAVEALVDQVEREVGPIDMVVNAADLVRAGSAVDLVVDDWLACFAVNAHSVFYMSRAAAARMVVRRRGAIVTVACAPGSSAGQAAYAAAKAAAAAYMRELGAEVAGDGVRCAVVVPTAPVLRSVDDHDSAVVSQVLAALAAHADGGTAVGA
jgi:2,3-dihydro-2,3-dihydroxybenzoate dehydrogenase